MCKKFCVIVFAVAASVVCIIGMALAANCYRRSQMKKEEGAVMKAMARARAGCEWYWGKRVATNYRSAVEHLELALTTPGYENAEARGILAECYFLGRGHDQDLDRCRYHAEIAARLGDARGTNILAKLNRIAEDKAKGSDTDNPAKCTKIKLQKGLRVSDPQWWGESGGVLRSD